MGLASVTAAIDGTIGGISENLGQWRIWPLAGAAGADPYTRAHFTAQDRLPPNSFEVQEYETGVDSEGRSLDFLLHLPARRAHAANPLVERVGDGLRPQSRSAAGGRHIE